MLAIVIASIGSGSNRSAALRAPSTPGGMEEEEVPMLSGSCCRSSATEGRTPCRRFTIKVHRSSLHRSCRASPSATPDPAIEALKSPTLTCSLSATASKTSENLATRGKVKWNSSWPTTTTRTCSVRPSCLLAAALGPGPSALRAAGSKRNWSESRKRELSRLTIRAAREENLRLPRETWRQSISLIRDQTSDRTFRTMARAPPGCMTWAQRRSLPALATPMTNSLTRKRTD
mmetsp:Transcript_43627/g.137994  ORF Transcript_43627/g.137994 Transcript_43627/m.137994 type:complete len:232 (-) Transcript_43627:301-996(-)